MPRHPTPAQQEASRRNGAHSQGPHDTSRTRFNALRHGLLSEGLLFASEAEQQRFIALHHDLVADLRPVGPLEDLLVERIATCYQRLGRAGQLLAFWTLPGPEQRTAITENHCFANYDLFGHPNIMTGGATLLRYERALDRELYTALRMLHTLQDRRHARGTPPSTVQAPALRTPDQPPATVAPTEDPPGLPGGPTLLSGCGGGAVSPPTEPPPSPDPTAFDHPATYAWVLTIADDEPTVPAAHQAPPPPTAAPEHPGSPGGPTLLSGRGGREVSPSAAPPEPAAPDPASTPAPDPSLGSPEQSGAPDGLCGPFSGSFRSNPPEPKRPLDPFSRELLALMEDRARREGWDLTGT